jgi:hypothetical protein
MFDMLRTLCVAHKAVSILVLVSIVVLDAVNVKCCALHWPPIRVLSLP